MSFHEHSPQLSLEKCPSMHFAYSQLALFLVLHYLESVRFQTSSPQRLPTPLLSLDECMGTPALKHSARSDHQYVNLFIPNFYITILLYFGMHARTHIYFFSANL